MIEPTRAACLTPPAAGGVAVIQVVGLEAPGILAPHFRCRKPLDLDQPASDEIRLVGLVDGSDLIDDALVCVRRSASAEPVIDICLHGGPRVVQRALLLLKRQGVRLVEPIELLKTSWPRSNEIQAEALAVLLGAKTRAVAIWLTRTADRLLEAIERITRQIDGADWAGARSALGELCDRAEQARYLTQGVRVVLIGEPNTGKSTLANTLAEREHAVVSDVPGTTRDYLEHPAAIAGVPFTFVDTAGIRLTNDPIEAEAIRRAYEQIAPADMVIRLFDLSAPLRESLSQGICNVAAPARRNTVRQPWLLVWNKNDLAPHPGQQALMALAAEQGLSVSARTGAGLAQLRTKLLQSTGLASGSDWPVAPFTGWQAESCRQALAALADPRHDRTRAIRFLESLRNGEHSS